MKTHVCSWPNCGKSFTRAEHLRRHALNHEQVRNGYTCERCSVYFHRPDLLSRHMLRHVKRDEEAGGPGLGVLETRKRTRRAGDGSIVTRPPKRPSRQTTALRSSSSAPSSSVTSGSPGHIADGAPVTPPESASDPPSSLSLDDPDPLLAPMMPGGPFEPYVEPIPGQFDAADGSWGAGFAGDFFNTDTATDFNLPFAATHNYNWLFDVDSLDDAFHPLDLPLGPDLVTVADAMELPQDPLLSLPLDVDLDSVPAASFEQDGSSVLLQAASYVERSSPEQQRRRPDLLADLDWMTGPPAPETSLTVSLPRLSEESRQGILSLVAQSPPIDVRGQATTWDSPLLSLEALQSYCDLFFTRFNTNYPLIHMPTFDPNTIESVFLAAILSMGATYSTRDAHQLAVGIHDTLRNHLFSHVAFSPQPDLWVLQSMLLIDCFGKMRAGPKQREHAQLFHCVLIKLIRRSTCCSIRSSSSSTTNNAPSSTTPQLPFLTHATDAEKAQAWHAAMDAEQRKRLALQCFMWDTQHAVLFSQSLCMSAFEIRSALPCSQSLWDAPSANEWARRVTLEAQQPEHLFLPVLKAYITPYSSCTASSSSSSSTNSIPRPRDLNPLARLVILHGLMSVSADLKRRDQTTLRAEMPERVGAWTPRMSRAYDLWKADFDADCLATKLVAAAGGAMATPMMPLQEGRRVTGFKVAALALYRAASLALHVEVLDLQIVAGAPQILGRVVGAEDRERSRRLLGRWRSQSHKYARGQGQCQGQSQGHYGCSRGRGCGGGSSGASGDAAACAARHAACLLQEALLSLHDWETTDAFHFPWCLYLATLTCWAFHAPELQQIPVTGAENPVSTQRVPTDLSSLIVAMTTCPSVHELASLAGQYETKALVRGMAQQLAMVRWAVVHDAMKVLVNLG